MSVKDVEWGFFSDQMEMWSLCVFTAELASHFVRKLPISLPVVTMCNNCLCCKHLRCKT